MFTSDLHCIQAKPLVRVITWMFALLALANSHAYANEYHLVLTDTNNQNVSLSLPDLQQMKQSTIYTKTPWSEKAHTFKGPTLYDVLQKGNINSKVIDIKALNGYQITISPSEILPYSPILATTIDDVPMRIRDKGPLWLILPIDQYPLLQSSEHYAQMVWQIKSIRAVKD